MGTPFSLATTLSLPGTPGLPIEPLAFAMSAQYDSKAEFEYNLPASSGTKVIDFGTMPSAGAKAFLAFYEPKTSGPALAVTINGGNQPLELTPGGFLAYCSPVPTVGITAITLAYTGAGRVRVWLLG